MNDTIQYLFTSRYYNTRQCHVQGAESEGEEEQQGDVEARDPVHE